MWTHPSGHQLGAYHNDTKWSAKVSAVSGHVHSGIGTKALEAHLASKAKRYKIQNNESTQLPHTNLLEQLLSSQSHDRVKQYAKWMDSHPQTAFGHAIEQNSQANDLREAWKLRDAQEKKFGGKPTTEWGLFDFRSGKPK
jgi:outer membrane cobalamin receptor